MKKLLLKLRHWLIRKLGGYTEQRIVTLPRMGQAYTLPIDRFTIEKAVDMADIPPTRKEAAAIQWMKREFAEKTAKKIVEDAGVMSCRPVCPGSSLRIYRMTVCFVSPQYWLKTAFGDVESRHMVDLFSEQ